MRTRVLWLLLAALIGGACAVDEYFVDELTVTLEAPLDALGISEGYAIEGNQLSFDCVMPLPHVPIEAAYHDAGPHTIEVLTESAEQRSVQVRLHAWEDVDGDGFPGCDELGVRVHVDLAASETEVTLPLPGEPPEIGGAADEACDADDDSSR